MGTITHDLELPASRHFSQRVQQPVQALVTGEATDEQHAHRSCRICRARGDGQELLFLLLAETAGQHLHPPGAAALTDEFV